MAASVEAGTHDAIDAGDLGPAIDDGGTVVVAEAGPGGGFEVSAVAIDDTAIYWADYLGDRIMRSSIDGGQAQVVASSGTPGPSALVVDATYLYWVSARGQRILRCPKDATGCTPTVLEAPAGVYQIAVDPHDVYGWQAGSITACSINGCRDQPTVLATGITVIGLAAVAVDPTYVYWADGHDVAKCPLTGCGDASTILATGFNSFGPSIALDGQNVYWTSDNGGAQSGGGVFKCAIGSCSGVPDVLEGDAQAPAGLVTDGARVFFTQAHYPPFNTGNGNPRDLVSCPVSGCGAGATVLYTAYTFYDVGVGRTRLVVATEEKLLSIAKR